MKDSQIFIQMLDVTGMKAGVVQDYRPCSKPYTELGIPNIPDAITAELKNGGTLIYIPDKDTNGTPIVRKDRS